MKYLVLSDIHANAEALEAALEAADAYDRLLILGDLVGYGADPNRVIERLRALPVEALIRGNHDKVGVGLEGMESFNDIARRAIEWTRTTLTADNHSWLAALPRGPLEVDEVVEICHGAPFDEDEYVFDHLGALRSLRTATRPLCLFGHTHVPAAYRLRMRQSGSGQLLPSTGPVEAIGPLGDDFQIEMNNEWRCLVNCGAVGQPRDGDARAAFGLFDTDARTLTLKRTEYDVPAAQAKILKAGLPELLARRLAVGR